MVEGHCFHTQHVAAADEVAGRSAVQGQAAVPPRNAVAFAAPPHAGQAVDPQAAAAAAAAAA